MKVLIFHPALAPYRIDLFNQLSLTLDLKIIFLNENLLSQKFDQEFLLGQLKCKYTHLKSGVNLGHRAIRWGIRKAVDDFQPDIVVSMEFSPISIWLAVLKKMSPNARWGLTIWTADNIHICKKTPFFRQIARRIVCNSLDSLIVYSETVKKWYSQYGVPPDAIDVCPNIQREDSFRNRLSDSINLAQQHFEQCNLAGKSVILFVGRLAKVKNLDSLIVALKDVFIACPDAVMVLVGDGSEYEALRKLATVHNVIDRIRFVGRFDGLELVAWYHLGHCFVLPSLFEPYGAVVNEALLSGMPVLCSTMAGAADLICLGQNGSLVEPNDVSGIAGELTKIICNIRPLLDVSSCLRKSLMPITFQKGIDGFVNALNVASKK